MKALRLLMPLFMVVVALVFGRQLVQGQGVARETAVSRPHEALIIPGDNFTDWLNVPLNELALYRYADGEWQPVPFQIDEKNTAGDYVASDDGLLGAADELVFMSADGGDWISPTHWLSDSLALQQPRYVITVTDPLTPDALSWVYLYRSPALPHATARYVSWAEASQTLTGVAYTLSFTPQEFLGLSAIRLNDQPANIIDRQKLRAAGTIYLLGFPVGQVNFNEESILDLLTEPVTITLPITGPVRAIGGSGVQQFAFYGRQTDIRFSLTVEEQPAPGIPGAVVRLNSLRLSLDLADPTVTGLTPVTYYDGNLPGGVPVNGVPDGVPTTPLVNWQQIDGAFGGIVSLITTTIASGQVTNYYLDQATPDPDDTGDGRSFGDAGFLITNPDGLLEVQQRVYFLGGIQGNQGATYLSQAANPLRVSVGRQLPPPPPPPPSYAVFLPLLVKAQDAIFPAGE